MNTIKEQDIQQKNINWEFYKIFINLDKSKLPQLIKFIEEHQKTERNTYFQKEFQSSFPSFQKFLCEKK